MHVESLQCPNEMKELLIMDVNWHLFYLRCVLLLIFFKIWQLKLEIVVNCSSLCFNGIELFLQFSEMKMKILYCLLTVLLMQTSCFDNLIY